MDLLCSRQERSIPKKNSVCLESLHLSLADDIATEKDCSDVWAVRGSDILGMIVATYDNEPYAHMLPIEQVFAGTRSSYTDRVGGSVGVDIGLPLVNTTTVDAAEAYRSLIGGTILPLGARPNRGVNLQSTVEILRRPLSIEGGVRCSHHLRFSMQLLAY
jgi:hypothetical protein